MKLVVLSALCLAVLPNWTSAAGVATEIFPSLRKHRQHPTVVIATQISAKQPKDDEAVVDDQVQEVPAAPAAPTSVPAALDAGADGFPELPSVSQMLSSASGTLKTVNNQASSLEARVVQAQMQSETKMAKQKAAFEEKLKLQEQGNQEVIWANGNISADIKTLKASNAALRKNAKEVGESNKLMRSELKTLQAHLGIAKDFTGKSLTSTDDSKNSLLQVLKKSHKQKKAALVETASKSHKDDDDDDDDDEGSDKDDESDKSDEKDDDDKDDDDEEEGSTSFLSVSMKTHRGNADNSFESAISDMENAAPDQVGPAMPADTSGESPENLLAVLSKQVAALANQEKESEKSLKNLFIRDYRAGAKRHQALLTQQKNLMATRSSLQALKVKLETAVEHLKATDAQLEARLHGLGQYLQKLAHFAMAPQNEVTHLMEVLPKAVNVKVV